MIFNYILLILKLILFSAIIALPITFICELLNKEFNIINKKTNNYILSLYILIYIVSLIFVFALYFIPVFIISNIPFYFLDFLINIFRLIVINLMISAIILIFALINTRIYEMFNNKRNKTNKNKNKNKLSKKVNSLNPFDLWKSLSITLVLVFILYLIFPNMLSLVLYLIYM